MGRAASLDVHEMVAEPEEVSGGERFREEVGEVAVGLES
jgi:hypothetical protein